MGIEYSSVIGHPIDEVFGWHGRPGAFLRLIPPWQPMTAVQEASSLADGTAILGLPGGLRWVAQHNAAAYDPPHRFVDELSSSGPRSWPARVIGHWRHTHEFTDHVDGTTLMHDTVDTPVPGAALRSTFVYRHRQLADDLAAHQVAARHRPEPMVVGVTGASGLVGSALCALLTTGGHRVIRLVRRPATGPLERQWRPDQPAADVLAGLDAVVHLAGTSIAGRFTDAHKTEIRDSRIEPTRRLAEVAAATTDGPRVFVSASAVGYYGYDRGDALLCEESSRGDGFLADVVADWEAATGPAAAAGLRVVAVRTGIVQAARGGTLRLLRPLFSAGLGGRLGSGRQWLSWIGLDDLIDIYYRALYDDRLTGPVNAVGPNPVRNTEYTAALARVLHRPALLPVPSFGPRLLLGAEGVRELAEADQRVLPTKLLTLDHRFRHAAIADALAHQLGHE
ncbi:TIGR01777 family oxidoreductase [Mycolicibacterium komossense]|uniref:TIGR01777 family protein n=1 Tax=Mycolicibacterium komossense TaxID=1779 RepID=A0ABT3C6I9_9MYCO|nr:TIGR01777 family oxidoreductase [Mycolicibacterium komossense]MCV7225103.1 TIGR01777 family protein [Mycolicibacterium komossense]